MNEETGYSNDELELIQRWLVARVCHLSDIPATEITPELDDYAQFLTLELNFVSTVLSGKIEGGGNGKQD
mgnify:CR=1 FL=1|jgi:hypothetical protein